jgi:hypothetical protein
MQLLLLEFDQQILVFFAAQLHCFPGLVHYAAVDGGQQRVRNSFVPQIVPLLAEVCDRRAVLVHGISPGQLLANAIVSGVFPCIQGQIELLFRHYGFFHVVIG